jgi:hypothetical protein
MNRQALIEEIDRLAGLRIRREDEVTYRDMMDLWHVTKTGAEYRLGKLVREGKLVTELVYDPEARKTVRVWGKAEEALDGEEEGAGSGRDGVPGGGAGEGTGRTGA